MHAVYPGNLESFARCLAYQYDRIALRISSPGGSLLGLTHILQCVEHWRKDGREIHTEATFLAASAGALLLTLGAIGTRTVQRHTSLLWHHTRIGSAASGAITAGDAQQIASILKSKDHGLLKQVVSHITQGLDGLNGLSEEGGARCELLRKNADAVANQLHATTQTKLPKWLSTIGKVYRDCITKGSSDPYQRYLEQRLKLDTQMDIREAYALCLIDCVNMAPVLVASARSITQKEPDIRIIPKERQAENASLADVHKRSVPNPVCFVKDSICA